MTLNSPGERRPFESERVRHGTGVTSARAFPTEGFPEHPDPFVLFERFHIEPGEGFPMHPHRGFEIVSYMLEGGMAHEDSLGVANTADEGDVMRITTGSGIRHSEVPAGDAYCSGLQLWVNLPREDKDADPAYVDARGADLPRETGDGATVTTVVGEGSPVGLRTPMTYHDVTVHDCWRWTPPEDWRGFLYGVDGAGTVDGEPFGAGGVLVTDGRPADVDATDDLRLVAVAGRPHGQPIRQRGPFVL